MDSHSGATHTHVISNSLLKHADGLNRVDLRRNRLGKSGALILGKAVKQAGLVETVCISEAELEVGSTNVDLSNLNIGYQGRRT